MSDAKILYKSLYWKSLQYASSFLVNIFLARLLGAVVAAEFYTTLYWLSFIISFFTFGLDISLNYYLSRNQVSSRTALRIVLALVLLALLISIPVLAIVFDPVRLPHFSRGSYLFCAAAYIAGGLLTTLCGTLFTARGRNHTAAIILLGGNLLILITLLLIRFCWKGGDQVTAIFAGFFLFSLLQGLWLLVAAAGMGRGDGARPAEVAVRELFRFSSGVFLINLLFFLGTKTGIYLLPWYANPADQGNYMQAWKIVEYMSLAVSFVYYPFMALVAGREPAKMQQVLLLLVRLSNTCVLLAGLFLLSAGWWLFPLVFGSSFDRMYLVFAGFLPGLFAACSSSFFTAWFFGRGLLRVNLCSAMIQLLAAILFFFLLLPFGGILGVAFSWSLSALLSLFYDIMAYRRLAECRIGDFLLVRRSDLSRMTLLFRT